ncbi:hypothetical protein FGM00_06640 [Aggregatimonas sangjinii]|uniref:Uncharacterized protein n=1 Tax=Aggregatimonas sangjinii TaxID=2583587 RepID=A0A5B7SS07_9FLAO|nr:hypothetical protein [Aggregatimonas sangjinii]QCW99790.1 hypothetical protein FGM00_06640 [Aggregatimonas sangjinii]
MSTYYQPSNKFSPLAFIHFIVACATAIPILALIYSYAIWYIPFPYINFFITLGFGFGIGWVVQKLAIRMGKVRNDKLAFFLGFLGALIGLYLSWAVWVDLVINAGETYGSDRIGISVSNIQFMQVLELALQPGVLFELMGQIMDVGVWGFRSATVSGWFLGLIWVIEALIVLVVGTIIPPNQSGEPFCELNQKWFQAKQLPALSYLDNRMREVTPLENNDFEALKEISAVPNPTTENHSLFTLYSNKTNENYLSVQNRTAKTNDKGETKFTDDEVVTHLRINEEFSDFLMTFSS